MTRQPFVQLALCSTILVAAVLSAGCGGSEAPEAPVATPSVRLSHDRAPAGSPLDITYRFDVASGATFTEDFRVFVHVVDTDEEQMWTDDHNPPVPTSQWKAGQTVEYTRTIFVPIFPYVGSASVQIGMYSTNDQRRLPLGGQDIGQRAYRVATLELLPQTENLFTIFKDGWHPAEVAEYNASVEWQWTKKQATLSFRNPKKDSTFYLEVDSPGAELHGPQSVQVTLGGQSVDEFMLPPNELQLRRIKLGAAQLGAADMAELQLTVDTTFIPSQVNPTNSKDPRELGIRVFHAFVDPR